MRRVLLTAAGVAALALNVPGAALAGPRHHHHKRHTHHARVSFRHLGPFTAATAGPTTPSTGSTPTAPAKTTTTTPTEENAGTVASYTGGVLTLTLGNGSSVSGKVTNDTRIECVSTTQPTGDQDDEEGPGDDNGAGDDQSWGDRNQQGGPWQDGQQGPQGDQGQGGDENGADENQGDDDAAPISTEPPCDSSALEKGAIVRAAELRIAPGGTEFESIELVR